MSYTTRELIDALLYRGGGLFTLRKRRPAGGDGCDYTNPNTLRDAPNTFKKALCDNNVNRSSAVNIYNTCNREYFWKFWERLDTKGETTVIQEIINMYRKDSEFEIKDATSPHPDTFIKLDKLTGQLWLTSNQQNTIFKLTDHRNTIRLLPNNLLKSSYEQQVEKLKRKWDKMTPEEKKNKRNEIRGADLLYAHPDQALEWWGVDDLQKYRENERRYDNDDWSTNSGSRNTEVQVFLAWRDRTVFPTEDESTQRRAIKQSRETHKFVVTKT